MVASGSAAGHSANTAGAPAVSQISTVGKPSRRNAAASHSALARTSGAWAGSALIDGIRSHASRSASNDARLDSTYSLSAVTPAA